MRSDSDWWSALKEGDEQALEHIYSTHIEDLLQYGMRFSQDASLVEDGVHDLFIQLWKKRSSLGQTDSIRAYLLVSLRRTIIRMVNKRLMHSCNKSPEDYDFQADLAIEDMIIEREISEEQSKKLEEAFSELSKRQREVLYLRFYQDVDYDDICEIMDIGYQSVRNLVSSAIRNLRNYMEIIVLIVFFL